MTVSATVTLPDGRRAKVSGPDRDAVLSRVNALRSEQPAQQEPSTFRKSLGKGEGVASVVSSAIAEPVAGVVGLGTAAGLGLRDLFTGQDTDVSSTAADVINRVRDFISIEPQTEAGRGVVEDVGRVGDAIAKAGNLVSSGIVGAGTLATGGGIGQADENVRGVQDEGLSKFLGEAAFEATGRPSSAAAAETLPAALLSLIGVRGARRLAPEELTNVSRNVAQRLQDEGIDVTDTSPQNLERMRQAVSGAEEGRIQAFRDVGIDNPTRAQITRNADDFQRQQEANKTDTPVRRTLESQEAQLSQRLDETIEGSQGNPGARSTVTDEITNRFTAQDSRISELYTRARNEAGTGEVVNVERLVRELDNAQGADRITKGLPSAIRGDLRNKGVIDREGNVLRRVSVAEAEDIRIVMNSFFDSTSGQGRRLLSDFKDTLDTDVFRAAGRDVFRDARAAKAEFEGQLSAAKLSKFDKRNRNLVRDILENKIDPDDLANRVSFSKSTRASDLRQLKDFLQQTDEGIQAFDDLRAETLQLIKEKSFVGPEDANGFQAITRARFEKALNQIGDQRLEVLFEPAERQVLDRILRVTKLREPVRGTALGKGPSAQAVESLKTVLNRVPFLRQAFEVVADTANENAVLRVKVEPPPRVRQRRSGELTAVVAAGREEQ